MPSPRALIAACCSLALVAGCNGRAPGRASLTLTPVGGGASLELLPPAWAGRALLDVDGRLTRADIDHVDVELALAGTPQATKTVPEERLDEPVSFEHLRANTSYRVTVRAYRTSTSAQPISVDASSRLDVTTGSDDAAFATPTVATLPLQLADRQPLAAEWVASVAVRRIVAADASTLYVAESNQIDKIALDAQANGSVTVLTSLPNPTGLALDGGGTTLYYADRTTYQIGRIAVAGPFTPTVLYTAGSGEIPYGLTYEASGNTLLVTDMGSQVIKRFDPNTLAMTTVMGFAHTFGSATDGTLANGRFGYPAQTAVGADGTVYVAEQPSFGLAALRQADASYIRTRLSDDRSGAGSGAEATSHVYGDLRDVAVDPYGNLWFVDDQGGVRRLDRLGNVSPLAAIQENGQATNFSDARAIAFAPDGTLFVGGSTNVYRVK